MGVRANVRKLIRVPAWIYQRQQALWDHAVLAGGWTWLYVLCSSIEPWLRTNAELGGAVALLPAQWRVVMAALVFVLGVWRPVAGYAAFIVAVAYPLYLVSIYVMALALAVLILLAPVMALYADRGVLYLALLVLLTVVLAPYHLAPIVPLLAGLWWQGAGSWIAGGAAALWLKLCAALSGHSVDLWSLYGWAIKAEPIYARFHGANSLQSIAYILQPFGIRLGRFANGAALGGAEPVYPVSPGLYVLFNLLQVVTWAAVAFVVSAVLDRLSVHWVGRGRAGLQSALALLPGLMLTWTGFVALPAWLGVAGPGWLDPPWLAVQLLWSGLVAFVLDSGVRYVHRPVSFKSSFVGERRVVLRGDRVRDAGLSDEEEKDLAARGDRRALRYVGRWGLREQSRRAREQAQEHASDIMIELD
jgi:hypothetical protein